MAAPQPPGPGKIFCDLSIESEPTWSHILNCEYYPKPCTQAIPAQQVNPYPLLCIQETLQDDAHAVTNGQDYARDHGRDWMNILPVGMRFCPTDQELVECYLVPRVLGHSTPALGIIKEANIYDHDPHTLKDLSYYHDSGHMYFFTPLKRKDNSKMKSDRVIGGGKYGFWKATQKRIDILNDNKVVIGTKASLTHNTFILGEGNEKMAKKAQWLMAEYRLPKGFYQEHPEVVNTDEIALCDVYFTPRGKRQHN